MNLRLPAIAGFIGSLVVMWTLLTSVGIDKIGMAMSTTSRSLFVIVALLGLGQMLLWGFALRSVLGALDTDITRRDGLFLYGTAMFSNNVTPFGQIGGEPITAYAINKVTDTRYESSLAAIATVDSVNVVTSLIIIAVGALVTLYTSTHNWQLTALGLGWTSLVVVLVILLTIVSRNRKWLSQLCTGSFNKYERLGTGGLIEAVRRFTSTIKSRLLTFRAEVQRVASDRSTLAVALAYSSAGWFFNIGVLWLTVWSLGVQMPVPKVMILVPVSMIAGIAPVPGGFGTIEVALVGLLVTTSPIEAGLATAAALIYRAATFWLQTVVGGIFAGGLGTRSMLLD